MMESVLTTKGQTTIPKAARDFLRLAPGDKVKYFFHPDGHLVILPKLPITALKGVIPLHKRKPVAIKQMDEDVHTAVIRDNLRGNRRR